VALTLREVGGLTTEEIARAYLVPAPTIAQRIVRAKAKIQREAIDYEVPGRAELPARTESVLRVIYLVFNEGYLSTSGPDLSRPDLCLEAIRLGRLTADLLGTSEVLGLLALMLLHQTRFATRMDASGDLVLLEDQDRSRWDHAQIAEAAALIGKAWASAGRPGPYVLQAALAAVHAQAPSFAETDWTRIVSLYDLLGSIDGSPVVRLNRAVAIGMRDGSSAGIMAIDAVMADGSLEGYHLAHAARADLQRRLGLADAARTSYERALQLASQPAERRFLQSRLDQLKA
jgi:RNA polymerase sigma-70 factor (ECF subfamily)